MKDTLTLLKTLFLHYSTILEIKWEDLKNPPCTVQEAFDLAIKTETQIQVADSFKMELSSDFLPANINEIYTDYTSSDEFEVNEVSRGKKWNNNNYRKMGTQTIKITETTTVTTKTQENKSGNIWECKERDSKITLLHESFNFFPAKFGESFFKQLDLAMQLRKEELKKK